MIELKTYKTKDLVLQVNKSYNPLKLDLSKWDRFLDILCENRLYQKEAIINTIIYLISEKYNTIEDLIQENWNNNYELRTKYNTVEDYNKHLQLPYKLSATIDLATGTGKSYVIYGIAQIMLGEGIVDKVLVLCPSITIESGLTDKFLSLSSNGRLKNSIPENSKYKNPRIINANVTIKEGDICIENIHAVYENTGSSIQDSLLFNGEKVLILNDEVHHAYNTIQGNSNEIKDIRKWKEFLLSPEYKFKYMVGFTGTAYIDDEYFNDVIYRYSLRQAVDDNVVKMIDYVSKDESITENERFQKIYDNHLENKNQYNKIKPLTILITKDITKARQLRETLIEFLEKKECLIKDDVEKKVLIVTSLSDHKANIQKLKDVDNKDNSIEWIVSVSMLTEGWDVKNVFQIVPMEDRAFNSKLLIAQVLGRGLRIPLEYQIPQPRVRVFNHDSWSRNIKGLVEEILEIEMKLISFVIKDGERTEYNFDLYNIDYEKIQERKEANKNTETFNYSKGYIELISQVENDVKSTEYINIDGKFNEKSTKIEYETYPIDEIVNKIYEEFKIREWEGVLLKLPEGEYTKNNLPPKEDIKKIIIKSMERVGIKGDSLVEKNRQKLLQAFGTLLRQKGGTTIYKRKSNIPIVLSTLSLEKESLAVGNLRHNSTVFYSDNYENELFDELKDILKQIIDDESFPKSAAKEIKQYYFKIPLNLVFTNSKPEKDFVENISKKENIEKISSWIKSRDVGFYPVEYSIRKGEHPKQLTFNPDFFIKIEHNKINYIIVVEIKADDDNSDENKAKYKYAKEHFRNLNDELQKENINQKYIFHFLSPSSYSEFFNYLRDYRLITSGFRSDLEDLLE